MPGRRHQSRDSEAYPDPLIIQREPEVRAERRPTSTVRTPRSLTLLKFYNPLSRRRRDTVIVTERATRRRQRTREDRSPDITLIPQRGRNASSPPPPPIIRPRSVRVVSPSSIPVHRRNARVSQTYSPTIRNTMSPTPGQKGYVPLPPKIPTEEEKSRSRDRDRDSGRHSRQSRAGDIEIVDEISTRRRSPRPYGHRQQPSDPYRDQEAFLETTARPVPENEHFEVIQPNEPVRSRQRNNDVRRSKEYREMKDLAERNYRAAQEATQRCSSAEVRLQNVQQQLAALEVREDTLKRELDKTRQELEDCRLDRHFDGRERDLRERGERLAREERELNTKGIEARIENREPERPRASRPILHQEYIPARDSPARYVTGAPDQTDDPTLAYIAQAHAEARARGRGR